MNRLFFKNFEFIYQQYFRSKVWATDGRKYDAPLMPFRLYPVDPNSVVYPNKKTGYKFQCSVKNGDWDRYFEDFEDNTAYISFHSRFKEGVEWSETERFESAMEKIQSQGRWKGCESEKEVIEYLSNYDQLYKSMKKEGYKKQQELRTADSSGKSSIKMRYLPSEFDEITVDVGRDGTLIWYSGIHRLSIARVLDLDTVPVRIRVRHEHWQQKRDKIWNQPESYEIDDTAHPDLKNLTGLV